MNQFLYVWGVYLPRFGEGGAMTHSHMMWVWILIGRRSWPWLGQLVYVPNRTQGVGTPGRSEVFLF